MNVWNRNISIDGSSLDPPTRPGAAWTAPPVLDQKTQILQLIFATQFGAQTMGQLYEFTVARHLNYLMLNPVGRAVVMSLLRLPHQLTILPLPGQLNARVPVLVTGGSVNLYYSPETWWSWATQQKVGGVPMDPNHRVNSDDILLHELVH